MRQDQPSPNTYHEIALLSSVKGHTINCNQSKSLEQLQRRGVAQEDPLPIQDPPTPKITKFGPFLPFS